MKILFTGGGSGGHFYPILSVVAELDKLVLEKKLLNVAKYYMASAPYDRAILFEREIKFIQIPAGKIRGYFSLLNFIDVIKIVIGIFKAMFRMYMLYPDVVFGKGGYDSFPALFAARIFRIPVVIHESDTIPGSVNKWSGKFAVKIAVGFDEAVKYFPQGKVAHTGIPVRSELVHPQSHGAKEFFHLEDNTPTILVLGGSQGAKIINEHLLDALPVLLEHYQIIHQTGRAHFKEVSGVADVVLEKNDYKGRYRPFDFLNPLAMAMAAGAADLVIARAGATTIAEIALWAKPSILVPIAVSKHDHQRENAFSYARGGAGIVIEEKNLSPNILSAEIKRILDNKQDMQKMSNSAREFSRPDAGRIIAEEILRIGIEHQD